MSAVLFIFAIAAICGIAGFRAKPKSRREAGFKLVGLVLLVVGILLLGAVDTDRKVKECTDSHGQVIKTGRNGDVVNCLHFPGGNG